MAMMIPEPERRRMREEMTQVEARLLARERLMFDAALRYYEQGLTPLPFHPEDKRPLVEWKQYQSERPTLGGLLRLWTPYPNARLGLVTGALAGFIAVDIDPRHGGSESGLEIPTGAFRVQTPSGGVHFYLKHPGEPVPSKAGVRPGIDIRGDGGLIIAPPSPGYEATGRLNLSALPVAPKWVWGEGRANAHETKAGEPDWFVGTFLSITKVGSRNDTATRLAGRLFQEGLREADVRAVLTLWARERCDPPFPEDELARVINSIAARHSQSEEPEGPALRLHPPSTLKIQEIRFIIDALVPSGTLTLLVGRDKSGKTLLSLDMVHAVRTGEPFLDYFAAVQGEVIALLMDDPPGLVRERIIDNLGLSDDGLWIATHLDVDTDNPQRLLDALAEEAMTRKPALIVVDALYVLLQGAKQLHDAGEMRPLMRQLDRIAEESGAAVLLIHHPRKSDQEAAGSFVIRASAKSILQLSKPKAEEATEGPEDVGRRQLKVEGKFLAEATYALDFQGPGRWRLLGEAARVRGLDFGTRLLAAINLSPGLTSEELATEVSRRKGDVDRQLGVLARTQQAHSQEIRTGGRGRPRQGWYPGPAEGHSGNFPPPPEEGTSGENSENPAGGEHGDGSEEKTEDGEEDDEGDVQRSRPIKGRLQAREEWSGLRG